MRVKAPRAVAELLPGAVPRLGDRLLEIELRRAWPAIAGAELARRSRPQSLDGACLTVVVDNSPWLQELTLRAGELETRIRARCPRVQALRFTLGTLPAAEARPRERPPAAPPLDRAARRAIDAAAAAIPDETLARAARRLLTKAWRDPRARNVAR